MPKILVVDDATSDRRLAKGLLENNLDCEIIEAADGVQALALLTPPLPDLVLTDLQMPEVDGLELVEAVRDLTPLVPVILMTSKGSEEIAAAALRRGAAGYVPKKRLAIDLIPTVRRLLASSQEDRGRSRLMHHLNETRFSFVLPNDLDLIHTLAGHVREVLRCLPLGDETERLRVSVAIEEALKNALYHGSLEIGSTTRDREERQHLIAERLFEVPWVERRIRFDGEVSRSKAVFTVTDDGPGFDPSQFMEAQLDADDPTSRGITLMRTIMDRIEFNDVGNQITLEKDCVSDELLGEDD